MNIFNRLNYKNKQNNEFGFGGIAVIIILTLVILAGIFIIGEGTSKQNEQGGAASQLQASEKSYDFGTISMAKGKVEKIFRLTNSADKDIVIKDISTSCMCTVVYVKTENGEKGPFGMSGHGGVGVTTKTNETIKAGESRDIKVVYDPNAHGPSGIGYIDRFVYLADADGGKFQLEIKANVTP